MAHFGGEAGAALVFLIGYIAVFLWMLSGHLTGRLKWKSRYSLLFFHVTIRVASQGCGIAFGVLGFENVNVFLAYLILGAEGYFTLVLCAYRFLVSWHQHNLPSRESWLEPRRDKAKESSTKKIVAGIFLGPFAFVLYPKDLMLAMHSVLIIANVLIVVGGSYLAGAMNKSADEQEQRQNIAKILRTVGQSIFLACNALFLAAILATIGKERKEGRRIHGTLIILLICWFPLIIRGIFGVLQSAVWDLSYYNPDNYESSGFTARFTAIEYCLGVLTEWLGAVLLNATWFTSRNDPSKGTFENAHELKEGAQRIVTRP